MQVGFMMQKALGELFILKSTKPLPIIFKTPEVYQHSIQTKSHGFNKAGVLEAVALVSKPWP